MNRRASLLLVVGLWGLAVPIAAQEVTASLTGIILDASGSSVAGAAVTVTNVETNFTRTTKSSMSGEYLFTLLRPGRYKLTVAQPGFKSYDQTGIVLEINQRAYLEVKLEVGATSERIEVSAEAPLITTEEASIGRVIDNKSITRIPLNGRLSITGLMLLAPGIQSPGSQDVSPNYGITPTVSGSSNTGTVAFTLDGVSNAQSWIERGLGEWPPLDGIQEFKVVTSSATAEFGKANQIIAISKGGTNQLHFTLLEFNRNRELAAKNFFATQLPLPQYNRNEFGGNVSGPVYIPKIYNGKDRTFFFFNYEGFRRRQAQTSSQQVATAAMREGDFRGLAVITDPLSGAPFPNNIIPTDRVNAVTARLGQLYPLPNQPGTGPAGTGVNLTQNIPIPEGADRESFRIDHRMTGKDQLAYSILFGWFGPNPSPGPVSTFGGMAAIGEHNINQALSLTHTFSPTILSESRVGYLHLRVYRTPQNYQLDPSTFIPGLPVQDIGGAPQVSITNIVNMSEAGSRDLHQEESFIQNLTVVRGSHTLKMGFTYAHTSHYNFAARGPQRGAYNFRGQYSGNAYADFVLGYPATTQLPIPSAFRNMFRQNRYQLFFQDDWRVTRRLTINVGLRYEFQPIQPQVYGQASLFAPPGKGVVVFANSMPSTAIPALVNGYGVVLAKDRGLPSTLMDYLGQDRNNFAPRLGLAYKVTPHTVLRGGFGIYYQVLNLNYSEQAAVGVPFGTVGTYEQPAGSAPGFTMTNPFPGNGSVPANPDAAAYDHTTTPYSVQWNATLEHELHGGIALRASYVGQRNIKQLGTPNLNAVLPAPGPVQPRRPYQPFANINLNNSPIFQSNSNQLQAGVQKRYSNGLLISAEYQFSRVIGTENFMSPANYNDSRGNIGGIRRHVLAMSYVYDLPFGRGRALLPGVEGIAGKLISGWQIAGLTSAMSGAPFSPSFSTAVQGSVGGRPNVVSGVPLYPENRSIAQYFNPAAFSIPADFTYGNTGYDLLWGPGQQNWDMSLVKNTAIRDRGNLELRMDAFSAFNHPTFSNPAADITNKATVGRISSAGGNRTVQIGAKLSF